MSEDLLEVIKKRNSSRGLFVDHRPIDSSDLYDILEAARWAPTAHNMQNFEIVVVDDKSILEKISELESTVSPIFLKENYPQLSFSEEEWKQRKTGILANQFPKEWLSEEAQQGKIEPSVSNLGKLISDVPILLLVLYDPTHRAPASEGDFLGIMSLGFMIENMWLVATERGIGLHIVSAFGNEPLSTDVRKLLDIPSETTIALGIRLGYSDYDDKRTRVRREVEDFVSMNHYEKKDK